MAYDYSERRITAVDVFSISRTFQPEGTNIQSRVSFQISSVDGGDFGPCVTVELAIPDTPEKNVQEIETEVLIAAFAVLRRLTADPSIDLQSLLNQTRAKALRYTEP